MNARVSDLEGSIARNEHKICNAALVNNHLEITTVVLLQPCNEPFINTERTGPLPWKRV